MPKKENEIFLKERLNLYPEYTNLINMCMAVNKNDKINATIYLTNYIKEKINLIINEK